MPHRSIRVDSVGCPAARNGASAAFSVSVTGTREPRLLVRVRLGLLVPLGLGLLLLLSASIQPAHAQDEADWVLLDGPGPGITRLWASANGVVFAATAEHGLFRGDAGGSTWQRVPGPFGGWPVLPDPTDPRIVYGVSVDGVYKSGDGGVSWAVIHRSSTPQAEHLAVSPADHDVLYLGDPRRIEHSRDGGLAWETIREVGEQSLCTPRLELLAPHPTDPRRVFTDAGCYAGRDNGTELAQSTDDGLTWSAMFRSGQGQVPGLLVGGGGADPRRLYLATSNVLGRGPARLYRSDDDGASWTEVLEAADSQSLRFGGLAYDPQQPDHVFVATGATPSPEDTGVRVSTDGGASWAFLGRQDLGFVNDLVRLADGTLVAATNEGIWRRVPPNLLSGPGPA